MKSAAQRLSALPFGAISRNPDVVLALGVGAILAMMIMPLPAPLLDGMLALNLALAAVVLIAVLLSEKPLSISTFPTLLLITTLFRLALNVSTTRMILSKASAGEVVQAFGQFVVQGDLVVGVVIFLVITLVQFLVIGKGAERVAEVGARFTLDAMPGKQMSIDAALRSGALEEEEAQRRREELGRESQFYGAMDGAMKFIKGDAIAGLIITALNLVAGLVIGVFRNDLPFAEAAEVYSILTIGDGLVSQIPALLITLAAGVLTTRVASKEPKVSLGGNLRAELLASPKVLALGATFAVALGTIPGLPIVPFFVIAALLGGASYAASKRSVTAATKGPQTFEKKLEAKVKQAKAQQAQVDRMAPTVAPIGIDLDPALSRALGFVPGANDSNTELLGDLVPQMRDALYAEMGVRFPGVRIRSNVPGLPKGTCVLKIRDVPVRTEHVDPDACMAVESVAKLKRLGVDAKPSRHPLSEAEVALVSADQREALTAAGISVWSASGLVALHLAAVLRQHAKSFIGLQESGELVERLSKVCPTLVREVIPKIVSLAQLTDILRRLVDEKVSIRDLKSIVEALAEHGTHENDGVALTEYVRSALAMQIAHTHCGGEGRLSVVLLDPVIEDSIRDAIQYVPSGSYLALDPELRRAVMLAIATTLQPVAKAGLRPIILTTADIRRYVRKLVEEELPQIAVLSFQELPVDLTVQPLGRVSLLDELPAAA